MRNVTILLAVAVAVMLAGTAQAAVVVYEGFDYTGTILDGKSGGGEWGFATGSTWASSYNDPELNASSLSYPSSGTWPATNGGHVRDNEGGKAAREFSDAAKTLVNMDTAGQEFYVGVLMQNDGAGTVSLQLGTVGSWGVGINLTGGNITYTSANGNSTACGTYTAGETYFLALKVLKVPGTSAYEMRVYDPDGTYVTYTGGGSTPTNLNDLVVNAAPGTTWHIDEVRIGESWDDVTIPEPATMVLLGIGGIGVLLRRRKK